MRRYDIAICAAIALTVTGMLLLGSNGSARVGGFDSMMDELGDEMTGMEGALNPAARGAKLSLQFVDAVTGNPIPGGTVTFMDDTVTTDERGFAKFPFPKIDDREDVVVSAVFRKNGRKLRRGQSAPERDKAYVTSKVPLHFMLGTVWFKRFSISPAMLPGKLRFVLDWSDTPNDLDIHLVKRGRYHISYRDTRAYRDRAFLDRDDTDGHGPETITIEDVDSTGNYVLFVHDYTNRARPGARLLSQSKARVLVYDDNALLGTYLVPSGGGVHWNVLDIRNGHPHENSDLSDNAPR